MRRNWYHSIVALGFVALLADVSWAQPTPGYNNKIPESIMTPNDIETRAGTLKYFDGIPTPETAEALYNHLDYIRGVEAFLNGMPAASLEAIRRSQVVQGSVNSYQVRIFDQLMDSNPLFLTGNTDTVYVSSVLDLKRDGPTVIEIPPGTGPGTVNDAFFRFVIDTGPPGPDQGKGRQVPDSSARSCSSARRSPRRLFRRQVDQLDELVYCARLPQGRQAGLFQQVVPGRPEDLSAFHGR